MKLDWHGLCKRLTVNSMTTSCKIVFLSGTESPLWTTGVYPIPLENFPMSRSDLILCRGSARFGIPPFTDWCIGYRQQIEFHPQRHHQSPWAPIHSSLLIIERRLRSVEYRRAIPPPPSCPATPITCRRRTLTCPMVDLIYRSESLLVELENLFALRCLTRELTTISLSLPAF